MKTVAQKLENVDNKLEVAEDWLNEVQKEISLTYKNLANLETEKRELLSIIARERDDNLQNGSKH